MVAIAAIMLGLIAVVIANAWFSGMEDKQQAAVTDTRLTQIVVATQPLQFGTKLTQQNIKLQDWPANSIPQGAFRTLQDALRDNRSAVRPIVIGEPILADKVTGPGGRATLAALLPDGMRAYSVPVDAERGVAGFVLPGTMVDVLLLRPIPGEGATSEDFRSDVLISNVQVLAVDQKIDEKSNEPTVSRTATLAVSLYDAQRLTLATKIGTLSLALRQVETAAGTGANGGAVPELAASTLTGRQLGGPRLYVGKRAERGGGPPVQPARMPVYIPTPVAPAPRTGSMVLPGPPAGASMTVFRGSEPTVYPVSSLGGR